MDKRELARQLARLVATQPGFTVDADGNPVARGYTVGGLKRTDGDAAAYYAQPTSPAELAALESDLERLLDSAASDIANGAYIGGWRNGDQIAVDLVTVTRGLNRAIQLAKERQQLAFGQIDNYLYVKEWKII